MQQLQLSLLELPKFLLLDILKWLDVQSLCCVSRTCTLLSKLAVHPLLWPHFDHDGCAVWDVRCILARVLRLPPQVLHVQLDVKRSRKFPVTVPLHNLRPLLNITDTEGLADKISKAVQEQLSKLSSSLWRFQSWQQYPPAASLCVCRADRATVRASLRPEAVVPRLVQQLQQLGWPPSPKTVLPLRRPQGSKTAVPNMLSGRARPAAPLCAEFTGRQSEGGGGQPPGYGCHCSAVGLQQPQPDHDDGGGAAAVPQQPGGTNSTRSRPCHDHSLAMLDCLDACQSRCELLMMGRLVQLHVLQGDACAGPCSQQECLAGSTMATARLMATSAASRLPDPSLLRETLVNHSQSLGIPVQAAQHLAPAATRLLLVAAAADPSMLAFSLPGKPGWMLMLDKAVKILARLYTLQQVCLCNLGSSSRLQQQQQQQQQQRQESEQHGGHHQESPLVDYGSMTGHRPASACVHQPPDELVNFLSAGAEHMEAAWLVAGDKELQLSLAGLHEFANIMAGSNSSLARLYGCVQMLEAAASEYASQGVLLLGSDNMTNAVRKLGLLRLQVEQDEQQVMQIVWQLAVQPDGNQLSGSNGPVPDGPIDGPLHQVVSSNRGHVPGIASGPTPQMLLRCTMHIEALRALSWCLWLLGVLE